jgi:predicted nucleic acid-binding Zn ribbon protein
VPSSDEHRHCKVCGRVCAPEDETCSATCRDERDRRLRARRNFTYLLYGTAALLLLLLLTHVFA